MTITYYTYEVVGHGAFPEDMLRYDSCWPSRQADVPLPRGTDRETRTVVVTGVRSPTVGRWESFGWYVQPKSLRVTKV